MRTSGTLVLKRLTRPALLSLFVAALAGCQLFGIGGRGSDQRESGYTPGSAANPSAQRGRVVASARYQSFDAVVRFDPAFPTVQRLENEPARSVAAGQGATSTEQSSRNDQASVPGGDEIELAKAAPALPDDETLIRNAEHIAFCRRVDRRLSSVTMRNCLLKRMYESPLRTNENNPIYHVNFEADPKQNPLGKVLILGGVHGDELTSVSIVYLWIKTLNRFHSGVFDWRVVPIVNPDGVLRENPTRTNANGVDLNRNFPTYQWNQLASRYWKKQASATERKFPGYRAASEPETRWMIREIEEYQPDVIVTVHAPYNLVDYDAADRSTAPRRLGILRGRSLGTFPGSLGRYAGEERNIPVITLELPHATRMPSSAAVNGIWLDLVGWLRQNINSHNVAGRSFNHCSESLSALGCI